MPHVRSLVVAAGCLAAGLSAQALRHADVPALFARTATFDPARGTVLARGSGSLFELRNGSWERLPVPGRGPWSGSALFAAPAQRRLLMFGRGPNGSDLETWVCDMLGWTKLSTAHAPSGLVGVMTYDSARNEVVRFGDWNPAGGGYTATWVFDGVDWHQRLPLHSPVSVTAAAIAFDPVRQVAVCVLKGATTETWEWNGVDWTQIATPTAPPPDLNAAMAFDVGRARMVLVGGSVPGAPAANCWEYDGATWVQRPSLPGAGRTLHALVHDPVQARTFLIGGNDAAGFELQDVWSWDGTSWAGAPDFGVAPRATNGAAVAVEPGGSSVLLFGGGSFTRWPTYSDETWRWDGTSWTQLAATPPLMAPIPSPTTSVQNALLWAQQGQMFLLGGHALTQQGYGVPVYHFPHGMSAWNGSSWSTVTTAVLPAARRFAALAVDTQSNEAVLFGGDGPYAANGGFVLLDDTWTFDGVAWQQRNLTARPAPRMGAAMAYDPLRDRVVLFGGYGSGPSGSTFLPDTWEWDGTSWQQISTANAPPSGSMAYDAATQRIVLFVADHEDGTLPAAAPRAWTYDGADWQPMPVDGAHAVMAGQTLGGFGNELLHTAWSRMQRYHRQSAELEALGSACTADAALLAANRWPDLGAADFAVELTCAPPSSIALLAGATVQLSVPVLGCTLHVDPTQVVMALPTDGRGRASATLPVPATTTLLGAELFFQGMTLSPLAPFGLTLTRGLRIRVGR